MFEVANRSFKYKVAYILYPHTHKIFCKSQLPDCFFTTCYILSPSSLCEVGYISTACPTLLVHVQYTHRGWYILYSKSQLLVSSQNVNYKTLRKYYFLKRQWIAEEESGTGSLVCVLLYLVLFDKHHRNIIKSKSFFENM